MIGSIFEDLFEKAMFEKVKASWALQGREERKARLVAVTSLIVELQRIKQVNIFATSLGEAVIEDIIEGDWEAALNMAGHFTFDDEPEFVREVYAPLWAKFTTLVRTAYAEHMGRRTPSSQQVH